MDDSEERLNAIFRELREPLPPPEPQLIPFPVEHLVPLTIEELQALAPTPEDWARWIVTDEDLRAFALTDAELAALVVTDADLQAMAWPPPNQARRRRHT